MDFSSLTAKVILGTLGVAGTAGTGYLVWDNFINEGLTEWDSVLLKVENKTKFGDLTWQTTSEDNSSTTTAAEEDPQLKLTFTEESTGGNKTGIKLEISNKTPGQEIFTGSKIKTWSCEITKKADETKNLHIDSTGKTDSISKLKKSLGIGETSSKVVYDSLEKFIKRCASVDRKKSLGENDSLVRKIQLGIKKIGENADQWQLDGLDKFFVEAQTASAQ